MTNQNNVLPADFDGVFRFTNFTEQEFKARWDGNEYTFPPLSTTPMIIPGVTPEQVQNIRKKFAKELAISEFYKSEKFKAMEGQGKPGQTPPLYTDSDLAPFIQRCLEPLPLGRVEVAPVPKADLNQFLHKDSDGNNVTQILDQKKSLLQEGSEIQQ